MFCFNFVSIQKTNICSSVQGLEKFCFIAVGAFHNLALEEDGRQLAQPLIISQSKGLDHFNQVCFFLFLLLIHFLLIKTFKKGLQSNGTTAFRHLIYNFFPSLSLFRRTLRLILMHVDDRYYRSCSLNMFLMFFFHSFSAISMCQILIKNNRLLSLLILSCIVGEEAARVR